MVMSINLKGMNMIRSLLWEGQGTLVFGLSLVYTDVYTSMCVGQGLLATVDWREVLGPWSAVSACCVLEHTTV